MRRAGLRDTVRSQVLPAIIGSLRTADVSFFALVSRRTPSESSRRASWRSAMHVSASVLSGWEPFSRCWNPVQCRRHPFHPNARRANTWGGVDNWGKQFAERNPINSFSIFFIFTTIPTFFPIPLLTLLPLFPP